MQLQKLDRDDPRLNSVQWRDLVPLRRNEVAHELAISLPWLAASLVTQDALTVIGASLPRGLEVSKTTDIPRTVAYH